MPTKAQVVEHLMDHHFSSEMPWVRGTDEADLRASSNRAPRVPRSCKTETGREINARLLGKRRARDIVVETKRQKTSLSDQASHESEDDALSEENTVSEASDASEASDDEVCLALDRATQPAAEAQVENLRKTPALMELNEIASRRYGELPEGEQSFCDEIPEGRETFPHPVELLEKQNEHEMYLRDGVYDKAMEKGGIDCAICRFVNCAPVAFHNEKYKQEKSLMRHFLRMYYEKRMTTARPQLWDDLANFWNRAFCDGFRPLNIKTVPRIKAGDACYHFQHCLFPNQYEVLLEMVQQLHREVQQLTRNGLYTVPRHYGTVSTSIASVGVNRKVSELRLRVMRELRELIPQLVSVQDNELMRMQDRLSEFVIRASRQHLSTTHRKHLGTTEKARNMLTGS